MGRLTEVQSQIVDMMLEGKSKTGIAKELGIARSYIYTVLEKEEVQFELESRRKQYRKAADDKITGEVVTLTGNMIDMALNSEDLKIRFNATKYLLDRALGVPGQAKDTNPVASVGKDNNKDAN